MKKQRQGVNVLSNDDLDNDVFVHFESVTEVATRMFNYAKSKHPTRKIVSPTRINNMLVASMNTGTPVFGIVIFSDDKIGDLLRVDAQNTIQDYTDHERMRLCICNGNGNCLYPHDTDCENEIIYERFVTSL